MANETEDQVTDDTTAEETPEVPAEQEQVQQQQMVPIDRLNEVINQRNEERQQIAYWQQVAQQAANDVAALKAQIQSIPRPAAVEPDQNLTPQQRLAQLVEDAAAKAIAKQQATYLAPIQEVIEDTRRAKFEAANKQLPPDVLQEVEVAYNQYRQQIPNLDRQTALTFVMGVRALNQAKTTQNQAAETAAKVNQINVIARQTQAGPSAPAKPPKNDSEKTADQLAAELKAAAERGWK